MSWVAAMSADERNRLLGRVRQLIDSGETPSELPIHAVIGLAQRAARPARPRGGAPARGYP